MAFGLTQWLISFAIFLIVLTIITWSAVHLGRKSQNSTNITYRFLDVYDYSLFEWKNKSLHSMIVRNSTSQVIESTDSPTLFANDQGSEIPDSSHFYKIFRTFYSTESDAVTSANYDAVNSANYDAATATFAPFVIANDSTWNDDTTITLYNISNKTSKTIDDRRNVNGEIIILPYHISQTTHSTLMHETTLLDMNKLWKSDLSQSVGTEPSEFLQDKKNGTSNGEHITMIGTYMK